MINAIYRFSNNKYIYQHWVTFIKLSFYQIKSAFEYKDNIILINDEKINPDQIKEYYKGHIYALDLNEYRVLYTINPYNDNRRCYIFKPLKRMNVALSFDLAFLEIWNLNTVQCNTKIFMFETLRVFELENCQLVLMSKRGIKVINVKY